MDRVLEAHELLELPAVLVLARADDLVDAVLAGLLLLRRLRLLLLYPKLMPILLW